MPPPGRGGALSKHGTLSNEDLDGAVAVDVDAVLQHRQSDSTGHLFGDAGRLPPSKAHAVERRYTLWWKIMSESGMEDWVGLTKTSPEKMGTFVVPNLVPGDYKLVLKLDKQLNANPVTAITGTFIGSIKALTVAKEQSEEVAARGLPTQYMDVRVIVTTERYSLTDTKGEMDLGFNNSITRTFTVREADVPATLTIRCTSYSLVKRLKLQGQLLRCDLAPPKKAPPAYRPPPTLAAAVAATTMSPSPSAINNEEKARMGRELVNKAFSSAGENGSFLRPSVNLRSMLVEFYSIYAPEKVSEVDKVLNHFLRRDGNPSQLIKTLEDKYHVKFNRDGTWVEVQ